MKLNISIYAAIYNYSGIDGCNTRVVIHTHVFLALKKSNGHRSVCCWYRGLDLLAKYLHLMMK